MGAMQNELEKLRVYYQKDIDKIAKYNIWEKLTVRKLNLTRKTIQSVYKTKKEDGFRGDIIDYLCAVCLHELAVYAFLAYFNTKSIKKTLSFLEIYLEIHMDIDNLICRLILKDKIYLYEAFHLSKAIDGEEVFNKIKEMLYKRINDKLFFKPTEDNNFAKLTSD